MGRSLQPERVARVARKKPPNGGIYVFGIADDRRNCQMQVSATVWHGVGVRLQRGIGQAAAAGIVTTAGRKDIFDRRRDLRKQLCAQ